MGKRSLEVAEQYLSVWKNKDANAIRNLIHADIRLKNPDSEITGRDAYMKTVERRIASVGRRKRTCKGLVCADQDSDNQGTHLQISDGVSI